MNVRAGQQLSGPHRLVTAGQPRVQSGADFVCSESRPRGVFLEDLEVAMPTPVWVLLGFAAWTLATLMASVGVYRWSRILTGRTPIKGFPADAVQGPDFYKRAMRAHANCVENLPVYGAIVVAAGSAGIDDPMLDALACTILGARVIHTLVHLCFVQTNAVSSVRFAFFSVQVVCMLWMGGHVALTAS
jgi:uncharacterized MAPEG superfamily protein